MSVNREAAGESLNWLTKSSPLSVHWHRSGSIGIEPRNFRLANSHRASPPRLENIFVHSEQCGHLKPLIFSIKPQISMPLVLQKLISLRTSLQATICGVVTSTTWTGTLPFLRSSTRLMCSSEVPGGVSMTRWSKDPQFVPNMNLSIIECFLGPRQMMAEFLLLVRKAIDMRYKSKLGRTCIGDHLSWRFGC